MIGNRLTSKPKVMAVIAAVAALMFAFAPQMAEAKEYYLKGRIFDKETKKRISEVEILVTNLKDGKVIGRGTDKGFGFMYDADQWFSVPFYANPTDSFPMQVRFELDGYVTTTTDMKFTGMGPDTITIEAPVYMTRGNSRDVEAVDLEEVVVQATKIKMVLRGDTIVYNADAFRMSEGSMLDALIAQLPGAALDANGQITVNGKPIASLLLDGKDFFKGDPKVALQNLPAYTVKNIQVYDKLLPHIRPGSVVTDRDKELVMDVNLKKQYQMGFIGNVEGGYGTSGRYLARAFGLEYARKVRLAAYANFQNTNEMASAPGISGNNGVIDERQGWLLSPNPDGTRKALDAGVDYYFTSTEANRYQDKFTLQGNIAYYDVHNYTDRYEASSNILSDIPSRFGRLFNKYHGRFARWDFSNTLTWYTKRGDMMRLSPNFRIARQDRTNHLRSAQFLENPEETRLGEALEKVEENPVGEYARRYGLIYLNSSDQDSKAPQISTNGSFYSRFRVGAGEIGPTLKWRYYKQTQEGTAQQSVPYPDEPANNIQLNRINRAPQHNWKVDPGVRYSYSRNGISFEIEDVFSTAFDRGSDDILKADDPLTPLEYYVRDKVNSYFSRLRSNVNRLDATLRVNKSIGSNYNISVYATLNTEQGRRHLHYIRDEIDADFSRTDTRWNPELNIQLTRNDAIRRIFTFEARYNQELPEMTRLIRTVDTNDPLNIRLGNPDLKKSGDFYTALTYDINNTNRKSRLWLNAWFRYVPNRMSEFKMYDAATGVSTYQPVNINGSYAMRAAVFYSLPFDRDQKYFFSTSTNLVYSHYPDYLSVDNESSAMKSVVKNITLVEKLTFNWNITQGVRASANVGADYRNARSDMDNFTNINAWDFSAGATLNASLPWKLTFATDFNYVRRMGYEDAALNTGNFVWNAYLERPFLKGALVAKLKAFDILGQISRVSAAVNSLGRTETWQSGITRYVMLTLTYHFSFMPRKR